MLNHMNPSVDNDDFELVDWTDLPKGWYILNIRDSGDAHTIVGPFDTQDDVKTYCDDTVNLFDTERVIYITDEKGQHKTSI